MKNIGTEMRNLDRQEMRRIALGMPDQGSASRQEHAAEVFNALFRQLRAAFPASMSVFKTQADIDEFRRQWLLAFAENGITSLAQVDAGMRIARQQEKPFLPSPGQFVAWCREGACSFGITGDDVLKEYWQWRKDVFRYACSEEFPWSQPVMYHICLELRRRSTDGQLSEKELAREANDQLAMWEKRKGEGKPVPPIRRAIAAPKTQQGPTPAEILMAEYQRRKANGRIL
ncbi:replication protein P [Atlantibacter hermannii]|uniref:replication protein P n=1 Tax=Atlantibacter hermannii TaxID=565 RepID=UPI00296FF52E|nr:replication protein P [Atlantibacter hermannii]MDW4577442.1 replication protein P [Atlantibacter hermannii]